MACLYNTSSSHRFAVIVICTSNALTSFPPSLISLACSFGGRQDEEKKKDFTRHLRR
ncbi:uncharacterized protein LY89DRAFT_686851 [Mollisia scopiformis]|uniref:Uncharacterized protein n=1 Tax=Mollisia scopiformis TaxID=149040 RepID=A0A194X2X8_MOLSC|nr:uncharacterized protein LY89DRAFT_686851 [Mollisia scopiformis]KUJ14374.1 hypothetical protein LY89DRAFT_686851 [Mollisia scopiformis]